MFGQSAPFGAVPPPPWPPPAGAVAPGAVVGAGLAIARSIEATARRDGERRRLDGGVGPVTVSD